MGNPTIVGFDYRGAMGAAITRRRVCIACQTLWAALAARNVRATMPVDFKSDEGIHIAREPETPQ